MSVKEKLIGLRAVAERLPLGDHGDRCLRDLFLELVDVLTGTETTGTSLALESSRAPAPTPELVGVTAGFMGVRRMSLPAGVTHDQPAPAADVPDPAGETWLAELAAADAKAEAEAESAAAAKTAATAKAAPAGKAKNEPKAPPTPNGGH